MTFVLPILYVLSLLCFLSVSLGAQIRNATIFQSNPSVHFSSDWWISQVNGASLAFVNAVGADVEVTLPSWTVPISYAGFKGPKGTVYGVFIDCETSGGNSFDVVGAHGALDDVTQQTLILFTVDGLNPASSHTISVHNLPDARFNDTSQLTFNILNVTVLDDKGSSPSAMLTNTRITVFVSCSTSSSTTSTASFRIASILSTLFSCDIAGAKSANACSVTTMSSLSVAVQMTSVSTPGEISPSSVSGRSLIFARSTPTTTPSPSFGKRTSSSGTTTSFSSTSTPSSSGNPSLTGTPSPLSDNPTLFNEITTNISSTDTLSSFGNTTSSVVTTTGSSSSGTPSPASSNASSSNGITPDFSFTSTPSPSSSNPTTFNSISTGLSSTGTPSPSSGNPSSSNGATASSSSSGRPSPSGNPPFSTGATTGSFPPAPSRSGQSLVSIPATGSVRFSGLKSGLLPSGTLSGALLPPPSVSKSPQASAGMNNSLPQTRVSHSTIAIIVILCSLAILSVLLGVFVLVRTRRLRWTQSKPLSDSEGRPVSPSVDFWPQPSERALFPDMTTSLADSAARRMPYRPVNPYADTVPATAPLVDEDAPIPPQPLFSQSNQSWLSRIPHSS